MTPLEFFQALQQGQLGDSSPLPAANIKLGAADQMAAEVLLYLYGRLPDETTQGQLEDILDSAKFWAVFWGALDERQPEHCCAACRYFKQTLDNGNCVTHAMSVMRPDDGRSCPDFQAALKRRKGGGHV